MTIGVLELILINVEYFKVTIDLINIIAFHSMTHP